MQTRSVANQQHLFFLLLRDRTPEHISFINTLASLLHLSIDSVYRRVRGEKPLLMHEIYILCNHFGVSFDHFFSLSGDSISFNSPLIQQKKLTLHGWLNNLHENLEEIAASDHCKLNIVVQDLNCFHFFHSKELAIFKFLYWDRFLLNAGVKESLNQALNLRLYDSLYEKAREIMDVYDQIPLMEIWNKHVLNATLNQIDFVWRAGVIDIFEKKILLEKLVDLISLKEEMVQNGFHGKGRKKHSAASYQMVVNETGSNENAIVAECGLQFMVFLNYNEFWGWLKTSNPVFVNKVKEEIEAIKRFSIPVYQDGSGDQAFFLRSLRNSLVQQINVIH